MFLSAGVYLDWGLSAGVHEGAPSLLLTPAPPPDPPPPPAHGKPVAKSPCLAMSARRGWPWVLFRDGVNSEPLEEYFVDVETVILFFVECVLKPLVHEGAIFHNRPILRPQIRCLWNKSFLSFGNYFFLSSFKLQFSSTDTVNFISRGSDIPQSVEKIYISTWSLSESFVVKSK